MIDVDADLDEVEQQQPAYLQLEFLFGRAAVLWAERGFILGATIFTTVAVFGAMFLIPNRYTAEAVLNPPDMNPVSGLSLLIGMKSGLASGLGSQMSDVLGLSSPGQIYIRTLETRTIEDALIKRFDLQRVYKMRSMEDARKRLASSSKFSEDRKSSVIEIDVTDHDPNRASQIANAYAEELGKVNAEMASDAGQRERAYFEAQLQAAERDLQSATQGLGDFGRKNAALDVDAAGKGIADAIGLLQGQIIASEATLKGMRALYTAENPNVQQMEAQISEMKRQLAELGGAAESSRNGAHSSAQDSEPSLAHLWGTAPSYMDLYGQVKLKAAIVETLTEQFEIAKLRETRHISDIQVLDPAVPPIKKSGPHRALISMAVGFLVFCGLCARTLFKEWWETAAPDNPWKALLEARVFFLSVGSSRVDLQACKLEYSIVSPK